VLDLSSHATQTEFGGLVGISQPAVSDLLKKHVLSDGATVGQWLREYCSNLREVAAGRMANGDLGLATERAALARAQRERIEMQNMEARGSLVPVAAIEPRLKAAVISAREYLRNQPLRLAQQAQGMGVGELEQLLNESFDGFLSRLARLPSSLNDSDQDELDNDESNLA